MSDLYYIRPRREENPKKWQGPLDLAQLKQLAGRRQFSKELHEYSTDRQNWRPAKEIWAKVFPPSAKAIVAPQSAAPSEASPPEESPTYRLAQPVGAAAAGGSGAPVEPAASDEPEWYYLLDGVQQAAVTLAQLQALAANGKLKPTDPVWCPRFGDQWHEARAVPELAVANAPVACASTDTPRNLARPTGAISPLAIASFVLSLLGACPLPVIGSLLAVVFGHLALAEDRRTPGQFRGRGLAIAGTVIGYVMLGIVLISGIATVVVRLMIPAG